MDSAIYMIRNIVNNKLYIGQSIRVRQRIEDHKRLLRKGKHENDYLEKQVIKYGIDNFEFKILEFISAELLDEREIYWIQYFNSIDRKNGYNLDSGGNKGKFVSDETREKFTGKNNPMYGRKHSKEFIEMIRIKNRGSSDKLTETDVIFIKESLLNGVSQTELTSKFNLKKGAINKIAKCVNWGWVREDLNERLISLTDETKSQRDKEIIVLWEQGYTMTDISKLVPCDISTASRILKIKCSVDRRESIKDRNKLIEEDYNLGMTKNQIMSKYNISETTYKRVLRISKSKFKAQRNDKIISLWKQGRSMTYISKVIPCNRETVSKVLKSKFSIDCGGKITK